jgi:hypothetical protein
LANHLARLTGVNAADPARLEELGLAPPMFTTELSLRGEDNPLRLVGGRPQGSEAGYVQIAGDSQVFVLESAPFEMAFGLGSALFDLPRLDLALSELTRLELQTPGYAASFEREGEAWILADPELDLPVSALTVNAAAGELATWAAADYAGEKAETGLDRAPWTAVAAYEGGARKLSVGGRSALVRGRYVRLNGAETPLVMRQSDVDLVFPPLRDLFDRRLAPLDAADVTRLEVAVGGAETSLTRAKEGWAWAGAPVSEETAAALLEAAAAWQANGVTLQPPSIENYPARITAQSAGGAERVIELSAPMDDVRFTRVNGGPPAYLVLEDAFQALLAALPRGPEPADTPEESNP